MPYDSNKDLPAPVKKALPQDAQTIYRKAFNSAYDGDDSGAAAVAWAAVKKAGFKKGKDGNWHKENAEPPKTHEFDAEIFSVGKWNGDKYSESDLQDMVENFNALADSVKPPVKLGHAWKEGQPALGWVKSLKKVGTKLVATLSDVPQIVYDLIKAGRYKRVSSEIYWNYKNAAGKTYNFVLKAVALLGADLPAVDDLKDLTAYLSRQLPETGTADRVVAYESQLDNDFKIIERDILPDKGVDKMGDTKNVDVKEYIDTIEKQRKALEAAEKAAQEADKKLKQFTAEVEKKETERRVKEVTDECERLVKAGKLTPAERDKLTKGVSNYTATADGFQVPFGVLREFVEGRQILDTGEHGKDKKPKEYASASEELADRAKKYSRENKVEYEAAVRIVLDENPELADRYKME